MSEKYTESLEKGYTPINITSELSRCMLCLDAPCSKECPAGTNPAKFIRSARFRNFKGAATTIRLNNALGSICARVCPTEKYCQKGCVRAGLDDPIDIGRIQRYITDQEEKLNMQILKKGPANGKKVAIVGSGPSALQASASLAVMGYKVKVYEKESKIGGYLRYGIPTYRLPNQVLDKEIQRIQDLDVEFITNTKVGETVTMDQLKKENDAVIIAIGYSYGKKLPMFDASDKVEVATEFLKRVKNADGDVDLPSNILVIGGGDVAMDVVTTCKLLGVKNVTDVVYEEFDEFRASKKELESAQKMGVSIIDGYKPVKVMGNTVTFAHRKIESQLKVKADKIILAIGQYQGEDTLGVDFEKNEAVTIDEYKTSDPKVFVCGDIAKGDKTVVCAVKKGKEVALAIDVLLEGDK